VRELSGIHERPISVEELVKALGWKKQLTYKWLADAVKRNLVALSPGTHEKNRKIYVPGALRPTRFLPDPQALLKDCLELDEFVRYEDPLTGESKKLGQDSTRGSRQDGKRKNKAA